MSDDWSINSTVSTWLTGKHSELFKVDGKTTGISYSVLCYVVSHVKWFTELTIGRT